MAYNKLQFIAYIVHVGPDMVNRRYPGIMNIPLDIQQRCSLMERAIYIAHSSYKMIHQPSNVLKVFVAPEFFFRGPIGAYSMDDYQTILERLRAFVNDVRFKDWMFVFGTTLAFSREISKHKEVYNIAVVQKGNAGEESCRIVMKEHKSGIDFMGARLPAPKIGLPDKDVHHLMPAKNSGVGRERQKKNYGGESIFELGGITFGLEVCLDHGEQRLRKSPVARGKNRVQVQLIPSAGMSINPAAIVAVTGGIAFNCDGAYYDPKLPDDYSPNKISGHSRLCKITQQCSGKGVDAVLQNVNPIGFKSVDPPILAQDIFMKGPGELHFYPSCDLPKKSTRGYFSWDTDYGERK